MKIISYPGAKTYTNVIDDVKAHTDNVFASADVVTKVHETIHQINSEIRNKFHCPGFYILQDKALLVEEPEIKLSDVAKEIRPAERGPNYELYLIKMQQYWEDQPTYVFDEWSAYRAGFICGVESGVRAEDAKNHFVEFTRYAWALVRLVPELRPFLDYFKEDKRLPDYGTATYL